MKAALVGLGLAAVIGGALLLLLPKQTERGHHGEEAPAVESESAAKVHFMRKFVAALTEPPENLRPSPDYAPLLKQGAAPIGCADCHKSMDIAAKLATDPGDEAAQPCRMDRNGFMVPLMEKWVARLNKRHADRLRKEVTCKDCHEEDPRDTDTSMRILMQQFVRALESPPENLNPAKGWKPLLKGTGMSCATCHGEAGAEMERNLTTFHGPPPAIASDRAFMIRLMERWVRELNRRAKDRLVKAVVCTDCHEIDPRK